MKLFSYGRKPLHFRNSFALLGPCFRRVNHVFMKLHSLKAHMDSLVIEITQECDAVCRHLGIDGADVL